MYGYGSRILRVDLTRRKTETQTFDAAFARRYVGGNGFAARLLADSLSPETDPLSAENAVVLAAGPLTATPIWGTSRGHLASLSPQTGYLADSDFGGDFGTHLKRTGHDALFITGVGIGRLQFKALLQTRSIERQVQGRQVRIR